MVAGKDISPEKVAARLKSTRSRVKLDDLAETIIQKFGGIEAFADKYVQDYEAAKMGSTTRARLLDGAVKLMQSVAKKETAPDMDSITDDDLTTQIAEHLDTLLKSTPIVDLIAPKPEGASDGTPTH